MFYFSVSEKIIHRILTIYIILLSNTYANTYPKTLFCNVWVNHLLDIL